MDFQPLPNHSGKRYLPVPSGKYMVGTSDLMTATNVFLRCYYPTEPYMSSSDQFKNIEKFSHWLPALGNFELDRSSLIKRDHGHRPAIFS